MLSRVPRLTQVRPSVIALVVVSVAVSLITMTTDVAIGSARA